MDESVEKQSPRTPWGAARPHVVNVCENTKQRRLERLKDDGQKRRYPQHTNTLQQTDAERYERGLEK